jgi:hypothetical protein
MRTVAAAALAVDDAGARLRLNANSDPHPQRGVEPDPRSR